MSRLTIDDWDNKYTQVNVKSENFEDNGRFETFGKDLEYVLSKNYENIWTAVDCDSGMFLVAGYHLVNRVYYVVSNEKFENENEEYLIDDYNDSDK